MVVPPTVKRKRFIDSQTFKESEYVKRKYENALHSSSSGSSESEVHLFKQFPPVSLVICVYILNIVHNCTQHGRVMYL